MISLITQKSNGSTARPDQGDRIALETPSVVTLGFGPELVARFDRSGNDLVLVLSDGRTIVIEDFFVISNDERNDIVFEDEGGVTWWGQYAEPWTGFQIAEIDLGRLPPVFAFAGLPGALLGLAGGGALLGLGPNNAPPVAVADIGSVTAAGLAGDGVTQLPGQPEMLGNVLGNDSDPNRDPLTVTGVSDANGTTAAPGTALPGKFGTLILNADGSYSYRLDNTLDATRNLPAGGSDDEVFTYTISDGKGGTATATLTITIHGSNDAPVIDTAASDISAAITELADGAPGENATTHSATGTLRFADVDSTDSHTATVAPVLNNGSYLGSLTIGAPDSTTGALGWQFEVADGALDHLAHGQQLVQGYTVTLTDSNGASTTQVITVTLTGSNDAPVIDTAASDISAAITELADGAPGENTITHSATGTLRFADVDGTDSHTAAVTPVLNNGSYLGSLTLGAPDSATGALGWQFEVADGALDHLAHGEQLVQSYTVTLTDSHGASTTQVITVTLTGSNDRPEALDDAALTQVGTPVSLDVLANDRDGDNGDTARLQLVAVDNQPIVPGQTITLSGGQGTVTLTGAGELTFTPVPGFNGALVVPYTVDDGSGAADSQASANWTINVIAVDIADNTSPANPALGDNVLASIDTLDAVALSGRAPVGGSVTSLVVSDGTTSVSVDPTTITLNPDGSFSTTADLRGLADGSLTLTLGVRDAAGNTLTTTDTILKDTVTTVTIDPVQLIEGEIPTVTGRGEPGATLTLTVGTNAPVTLTIALDGSWTHTPATPPAPGPLNISATVVDRYGNDNAATREVAALTPLDTTPGQPGHLQVFEAGLPGGSSAGNGSERINTNFTITASGGDIRQIQLGGTLVGGVLTGSTTVTLDQLQALPGTPIAPITTVYGSVTLTGYDALTGTVTYSYVLGGNTTAHSNTPGSVSEADTLQESILLAVTDHDGDTRITRIEAVVVDDVPVITAGTGNPRLEVSETALGTADTDNLASLFAILPGADGAASTSFALALDTTVASGLVDTASGAAVVLSLDPTGTIVTGTVVSGPAAGETVLRITLDSTTGDVEFEQLRPISHPNYYLPNDVVTIANGALLVTATVVDNDGDSVSRSTAIGERFGLRDSGPSLTTSLSTDPLPQLLTPGAATAGGATASDSADFSGAFEHLVNYGGDGPAATSPLTINYFLRLNGLFLDSGLTSGGEPIYMTMLGGEIIGSTGAVTVFTISVDSAGVVTLENMRPVDQPSGAANGIVALTAGHVQLVASTSATDADGDSVSSSATLDIGASLRFGDDAPTTGITPRTELDEEGLRTPGPVSVSGDINADPGADRNGLAAVSLTFTFDQAQLLALNLTQGGTALEYVLDATTMQVLTAHVGGVTVFTVTLVQPTAANGYESSYNFVLHGPLDHPNVDLLDLSFKYRLSDSDGDSATGSFTVGVVDDVPTAVSQTAVSVVEGGATIGFVGGSWTTGTSALISNDQPGADGARVSEISYVNRAGATVTALVPDSSSVQVETFAGTLTVHSNGNWSYEPESAVTHTNGQPVGDNFSYRLTDGDGDVSNWADQPINVTDTAPVAANASSVALEGAEQSGNVIAIGQHSADQGTRLYSFSYLDDTGAPQTHVFVTGTPQVSFDTPDGSLTVNQNGAWTLVPGASLDHGGGNREAASFSYLLIDADGSLSNSATQTIRVNDTSPTVSPVSFSLDEKHIPGLGSDQASGSNTVTQALLITRSQDDIADVRFDTATLAGLLSQNLRSGGALLSYSLDTDGHLLTATAGGVTVFTLAINNPGHAGGTQQTVTATLLRPIDHASGNGTTGHTIPVNYKVHDTDSNVPGQLNFTIVDDIPLTPVADETLTVTEGQGFIPGVNLLENDTLGADGGRVNSITYLHRDGITPVTVSVPVGGLVVDTHFGTLDVRQDGNWSYRPLASAPHTKPGNDTELSDSFTYTLIDSDGDVSAAAQQSITIVDTAPSIGTPGNSTVNESDLPQGSAPNSGATVVTGSLAVAPGQDLTGFAARFGTVVPEVPLTSGGVVVKYAYSLLGDVLVGYIGDDPAPGSLPAEANRIFTLSTTGTASTGLGYSFSLQGKLDHPDGQDTLGLTFNYGVTDGDGDTATSAFTVTVTDDRAATAQSATIDEDHPGRTFNTSADTTPLNTKIFQGGAELTLINTAGDGALTYQAAHGTVTVNANGTITYKPAENFSGEEVFTYETNDGSEISSTTVTMTVTPVSDRPAMTIPAAVNTPEDTSVLLALDAPRIVDDGSETGNNAISERIGAITLSGLPQGAVLNWIGGGSFAAGSITVGASGQVTFQLDDVATLTGTTSDVTLVSSQFESIRVTPPPHSHENFTVGISVTSYEVDATGAQLSGVNGATTSGSVTVHVQAVTDPVALYYDEFALAPSGAVAVLFPMPDQALVTLREDSSFLLNPLLTAGFADLDGSELRWITISNPGTNGPVVINGITLQAGQTATVYANGQTGSMTSFPDIRIGTPDDFSGNVNNLSITLHAQDRDGDGHLIPGGPVVPGTVLATPVASSTLLLSLNVTPVAGDVAAAAANGFEDTPINFLAGVAVTDTTTGNEFITRLAFDVPPGWTVTAPAANVVPGITWTAVQTADNYVITFTGSDNDRVDREAVLDAFQIQAPLHSSTDVDINLAITTRDIGSTGTDEREVPVTLSVNVAPRAEVVGPHLTMNGNHEYTTPGYEDEWYKIGTEGSFNLGAAWRNDDANEQTFALMTPEMLGTQSGDAIGSSFRWLDGPTWQTVIYSGEPVQVPIAYLSTLEFKAPENASGRFSIKVEAYTVDYDDNTPNAGIPATAVSGEAFLTNLVIAPRADAVVLTVNGNARGFEDTDIPLSIRTSSSDPSETQTVSISGIPAGAVITYGARVFTSTGPTDIMEIVEFNAAAVMTIRPPLHSNVDFNLTVTAVSVDRNADLGDTYTHISGPMTHNIHVGVRGVADEVTLTLPPVQPTYTEAALDAGRVVLLNELVSAVKVDNDGSETLTFRLSGLPVGFAPTAGGATLMDPEAVGVDRVWVLTEKQFNGDATASPLVPATGIRVPADFSGTVTPTIVTVTTENDGNSRTSPAQTLSFTVLPSTESTVTISAELVEDEVTLLGLAIVHGSDTDERIHSIRIPVTQVDRDGDATGAGFSLRLGGAGMTLAQAVADGVVGITRITVDSVEYYQLSGTLAAQLSAIGTAHSDSDLGSFDFQYQIIDDHFGTAAALDASDNPLEGLSGYIPATFTLTARPVTDVPVATISTIGGNDPQTVITGPVPGDPANPNHVLVKTADQVTVMLNIGSPDHDGSEHVIRVLITGVPLGVSVPGAQLVGVHDWLLVLEGQDALAITGPGGTGIPIVFEISGNAQAVTGETITMTAQVQDRGNTTDPGTTVESASVSWTLVTDFDDGGGSETPLTIKDWSYTGAPATEDSWFQLSSMINAEVIDISPTATNIVTIRLENLPAGTEVEGMILTTIGNDQVWTATVTGGSNIAALLAAKMDEIRVRPPANSNENNAEDAFVFTAKLSAAVIGGSNVAEATAFDSNGNIPVIPVTPVTDAAVITVAPGVGVPAGGVTEADSSVPLRITVIAPQDGTHGTVIDGKLYLQIDARAEDGSPMAGGTVTVNGQTVPVPLTAVDAGDVPGLPAGNYYVVDYPVMGAPLDLVYQPTELVAGNVNVSAWVRHEEAGAANQLTSSTPGAVVIPVHITNNGVTITTEASTGIEVGDISNTPLTVLNGLGVTLKDSGEQIYSIMLANLPDGFLIFTGDTVADLSLAQMANNAGGSAGTNTWILAETGGSLPAVVAILPPPYWSGTLNGLRLLVASGETTLEPRTDAQLLAPVTIAPFADGVQLGDGVAFGQEGQIIALNLNATIVDNQDASVRDGLTVVAADANTETATLQFTGLGAHAAFYIGTTLLAYDPTAYNAATDTYTLSGLSQAQIDALGVRQALSAITDTDTDMAGRQITVTAWSVDGTVTSVPVSAKVTLAMNAQLSTTGNDQLIWTGAPINGRAGQDTVQLRYGESLTGAELAGTTAAPMLRNIEVLDLGIGGQNAILGLTPDQVMQMTDSANKLAIIGSAPDRVELTGDWIAAGTDGLGNTIYTGTSSGSVVVTLTVTTAITVEVPPPPAAGRMAGFGLFTGEDEVFGLAALDEDRSFDTEEDEAAPYDSGETLGLDGLFSDAAGPGDLDDLLPESDPASAPFSAPADAGSMAESESSSVEPPQPSIWDDQLHDLEPV